MRKGFTLIELMIVIAIIAIIAAIAIPNLLESRVTANEGAAAASLKSGIFPAQVQFQAGGYEDLDQNNVGEYGTIETLAGIAPTARITAGNLKLVQGALAVGAAALQVRNGNGYTFASMVSTESNGVTGANVRTTVEGTSMFGLAAPAAGNTERLGERYFAVGCQPDQWGDTGRRVFLMSQEGVVRSPSTSALMQNWYNALDPSVSANAAIRPGNAARLLAGMVHALTGTMGAPAGGTDVTGATYPAAPGFNRDYPVLSK